MEGGRLISRGSEKDVISYEQLKEGHYGALELQKYAGRNLLRGLLISVLIHLLIFGIPGLVFLATHKPPEAKPRVRVIDLSQLTKIVPLQDTPKQERVVVRKSGGGRGGGGGPTGAPLPSFNPGQIAITPEELFIASLVNPETDSRSLDPTLATPLPEYATARYEVVGTELPDVRLARGGTAGKPPSDVIAGPLPQRGTTNLNSGSVGLDLPSGSAYAGKGGVLDGDLSGTGQWSSLGSGTGSGSGRGSGRGSGTGSGEGPGTGMEGVGGAGQGYASARGTGAGGDADRGRPNPESKPAVSATELAGLLNWMHQQSAVFPGAVRSYLDTGSDALCAITSHEGWDIFIQYTETKHQLKIFLARGDTGILLADSDFRQRSQLFGQGRVLRDGSGTITAIEAMREKPTTARTSEFYRVFGNWLDARGLRMK